MRGFPQELVDKIIDMLTEEDPWESENPKPISNYSTVSRQWVERTRKHHFCYVEFRCQEAVEKWRTTFEADPSGISRHVRKLRWFAIDTLQGFDEHIRAFTQVKELEIYDGCLLDSLSEVRSIAIMGSSLERLWIEWVSTTPGTMATLLAGLPRLRHLLADFIPVTDRSPAVFPPNIPFFDGAGVLSVRGNYRALRLIPPTARFRGLQVDLQCVNFFFEPVNRLLASSGESLEWLTVLGDPSHFTFDRLDLSNCTSLKYLRVPIPPTRPGTYADKVLPSISSSRLSTVILEWSNDVKQVENSGWEEMDKHLCRLAKQFKAAHGGRKMEVMISVPVPRELAIVDQLKNRWPMPDSQKEVNTVVLVHEKSLQLGPEPWHPFRPISFW